MGLADLVPGVSGGTIALITGIYKELIETLNQLSPTLLFLLFKQGFIVFWKAANGSFLLCVFGGILSSVFLFSALIQWMLQHQQVILFAFFFGVLLASLIVLRKQIKQWDIHHLIFFLAGAGVAFLSTQFLPTPIDINPTYLFFCGFIAISAMILPGLSGAYLLLILGAYGHILQLVQDALAIVQSFSWPEFLATYSSLLLFVAGIITGLLTFSRILRWLLNRHPSQTMSTLLGLMFGAMHKVWPWQLISEADFQGKTRQFFTAVWPQKYPDNPQILGATLAFIAGIGILFALERLKSNHSAK